MYYFLKQEQGKIDPELLAKAKKLCQEAGLKLESFDFLLLMLEGDQLIAIASLYANFIRTVAIKKKYQEQNILASLISQMLKEAYKLERYDLFIHTQAENLKYFQNLSFYPINQRGKIRLLENSQSNFSKYKAKLKAKSLAQIGKLKDSAAIIMNANPPTKGHLALIEQAIKAEDLVHVFVVAEDISLFSYQERRSLLEAEFAGNQKVVFHSTGPYQVSLASFPSYFLKEDEAKAKEQASLDAQVFVEIAKALKIKTRYLGTEPFSKVTKTYNEALAKVLSEAKIEVKVKSRLKAEGKAISATKVRSLIEAGESKELAKMLGPKVLKYIEENKAKLKARIKARKADQLKNNPDC